MVVIDIMVDAAAKTARVRGAADWAASKARCGGRSKLGPGTVAIRN